MNGEDDSAFHTVTQGHGQASYLSATEAPHIIEGVAGVSMELTPWRQT